MVSATTEKEKDALLNSPFLASRTIAQNGWELFAPMEDYARLALDTSPWRVSPINWEYTLCETYPRYASPPMGITNHLRGGGARLD